MWAESCVSCGHMVAVERTSECKARLELLLVGVFGFLAVVLVVFWHLIGVKRHIRSVHHIEVLSIGGLWQS